MLFNLVVLGVSLSAMYIHALYLGNFPSAIPSVIEIGRYLAPHLRLQGTAGDTGARWVTKMETLNPYAS